MCILKHEQRHNLVGVLDEGKPAEANIGKRTLEMIPQKIREKFDPNVFPIINLREIDGKTIAVIEVPESHEKPVFYKDKAYKRVGKANRKISASEVRKLAKESGEKIYWDEQICKDARFEDIDEEKVNWFLRKARQERNYEVESDTPIKEALERLEVLKGGKLTRSAILMFGKRPQKFFSQAKIRCARFKGVDGLDYIDMKVLEGTIPELRENAIKFIMLHTKHGVFFDENRRYDRWEYPFRALEELLSNALAHREYESGSDMQVSVYDDRIEIWNPGELPKPLTPDDLKREHKSILRNRKTAETLFLIKYIEQWGKGTNRVIKRLLEHKLPEPTFRHLTGGFEVTVHGPGREFEKEIERQKYHVLDINERQKKAIEYVKEKGQITKREYISINNVSDKTAYIELNNLLIKNILKRIGVGRATKYVMK